MKSHIFAFILSFFGVLSSTEAGYYNMGAMVQAPRLMFSTPPSSSVTVGAAFPTSPSVAIVKPNGTVVSSATDTVTITAHTNSTCTSAAGGSLTAMTNPKAAVSGVASFTNMQYSTIGKIYLKATAPGKKSACSSAIIVSNPITPSPSPSSFKLTFNGPNSIGANNCTAYSIVLKDEYNNIVTTTSSVNINYSGAGTGSFYSNVGCTTATSSGTIAANSNQTTVYYKTPSVELNILQATDPTSQVVEGSLPVEVTAYKLLLSGPQTADLGITCKGPYNITYQTAAGGSGGITNVSLARNSAGSETFYSNSGCTTPITLPGPIATNGSGIASFYFKGPTLMPTSGPITLTVSATGSASASLDIGIGNGTTITKLSLFGTTNPTTGRCTQYNVTTQDASSNPQPVSTPTTITLVKTLSAQTYSDYGCKTTATSIVIPAGYSQGTFYFKDTVAETSTLTTQSSGLTQSALSLTTNAGTTPKISTGNGHSCILLADQTVKCWGSNAFGQLGNGTTIDSNVPVLVQGITGATDISVGNNFTCALISSGGGTVKCWGYNNIGQLGNGNTTDSPVPVSVSSIMGIIAISSGDSHTCAISSGTAYCWGQNTNGALGNASTTDSSTPVTVSSLGGSPMAITAGTGFSCALVGSGNAKCWGSNSYGQLGNGNTTPSTTPVTVSGISGATAIDAGNQIACVKLSTSVQCWGFNGWGQLGDGSTNDSSTAVTVSGLSATSISVGDGHVCATLSSNGIKCWGNNTAGQLGNNSTVNESAPVNVSGISTANSVAAGSYYTCAILSDQTAKCWGGNSGGRLGNGNNTNILTPSQVPVLTNVVATAVTGTNTCALFNNNTVKCFGSNMLGALGDGAYTNSINPVSVVGISTATAIAGGGTSGHYCALLSSKEIKCWGVGTSGQLGNGSSANSNTPVDVTGISNATAVVTGGNHSCALLDGGTVKCWGLGTSGQLGDGNSTTASSPVDVTGIANALALYAGASHTCALLSDQTVKCWGLGTSGQLGNNVASSSPAPVSVSGISTATSISRGSNGNHTCVILTDQTVKCWGLNNNGQLGDNTLTNSLAPVSVNGISTAYAITSSGNFSCALLTDKSIRCWGLNSSGQLGTGNSTRQSFPTPTLSTSLYSRVYAGSSNVCAVATDQTLWCWGNNSSFQTGTSYLVPGYVLNIPQ